MKDEMSKDFTTEDLPLLNAAMRAFPHVGDGFRAMLDVGARLSFPVESPEHLASVIADSGAVRYAEAEIPIEDMPALMPAYYFPIDSVEDFFSKVSDVAGRVREPDGPNLPAVRLREATAPNRADDVPTISDDEIRARADVSDLAAPSVGGIRKRNR